MSTVGQKRRCSSRLRWAGSFPTSGRSGSARLSRLWDAFAIERFWPRPLWPANSWLTELTPVGECTSFWQYPTTRFALDICIAETPVFEGILRLGSVVGI